MNKLKTLAVTTLAAATIGVGTLAAAPSASAAPKDCAALAGKAKAYHDVGTIVLAGAGFWHQSSYALASYYFGLSQAYGDMALDCIHGT